MLRLIAFLLLGLPAAAGAQPARMPREELVQLYTEAGFAVDAGQPLNRCAEPARPGVAFVNLNGDAQAEALFVDASKRCYGAEHRFYAVLTKQGGQWRLLVSGEGQVKAQPRRGRDGFFDLKEISQGCERLLSYDGRRYQAKPDCAATPPATPTPATEAAAATATAAESASPATLPAAEQAGLFQLAGFKRKGKRWVQGDCDDPSSSSYQPGALSELRDLNGDGQPEAVLTEGGSFCHGNTGQGFWLLSRTASGAWTLMTSQQGFADFLATKGRDGYPDIQLGGPGFCFPVLRWDGREYRTQRWQYDGKPCKRPS